MKKITGASLLLLSITMITGCTSTNNEVMAITTSDQPESTIDKQVSLQISENQRTVSKGLFKANLENLVKQNGYQYVKWDSRVNNCSWQQDTSYVIPANYAATAEEIITFYARTQDFYPQFSTIDQHVMLNYVGNPSNLLLCSEEK